MFLIQMVHHISLFANVNSDSSSVLVPDILKSLFLSLIILSLDIVISVLVNEYIFV